MAVLVYFNKLKMGLYFALFSYCFITNVYSVYVPNESQATPRPYTSSLKIPHSKASDSTPLYHSSYSKVYVHNNKNYTSSLNDLNNPGKKVHPVYSKNENAQKIEHLLEEHNSNIVDKDTLNNRVVYKRRIEKSQQIPVYNKCPKGETGQFVYDLSCNQYLDCWKGRGSARNCAPGTLFNPKTLECDFPEKVECITGPGRTSNIVQRSAKLQTVDQATCPEGFTGLIPNYTDCARFIQCNNGQPFSQNCPPGTLFDMSLNVCNFPDKCVCFSDTSKYMYQKEGVHSQYGVGVYQEVSGNQIGSGWSQPTGYQSPHTTTNYQEENSDNYPGSGTGVSYLQYVSCDPNKYDCSQYSDSKTVVIGCDPFKQDCGRTTGQNSKTVRGYSANSASYNQIDSGCNSQNPNCAQGTRTSKNYDTICNINDKKCLGSTSGTHQNFQRTSYGGTGTTHQEYHQGSTHSTSGGSPTCPDGFQGITKHPSDCKKFLNCANGITYVQDCAPGTLFNPLNNVCDFPYNVKCEGGGTAEVDDNYINPEYHRTNPRTIGQQGSGSYGQYQPGDRQGKCQGQSCQSQGSGTSYNQGKYGIPTQSQTNYQQVSWNQNPNANQWNSGQNPCTGTSCHQGMHTNTQGYIYPKPTSGHVQYDGGANPNYGQSSTDYGTNLPYSPTSGSQQRPTTYNEPQPGSTVSQGSYNYVPSSGQSGYTSTIQSGYPSSTNLDYGQTISQYGSNAPYSPSSGSQQRPTTYVQTHPNGPTSYPTGTRSYNQVPCQPGQTSCTLGQTNCQAGQSGCQSVGGCPPGYSCQPTTTGGDQQPSQGNYQPHQGNYYPPSPGNIQQPSPENILPTRGNMRPSQGGYPQENYQQPTQPEQGGYQIAHGGGTILNGGYNITQGSVVPCHPDQTGCTPIIQPSPGGQRIKKVYVVEEVQTPEGGYGNVYPVYQVEQSPYTSPEAPQLGGSASYVPSNFSVAQNKTYQRGSRPEASRQPNHQGIPVQVGGYRDVQPIHRDDDRTYQGYSNQRLPDYVDIFDPSETRANSLAATTKKPKVSDDQQVVPSYPQYVFEYEDGEQVTLAPEVIVVQKRKKTCEKGDFKCDKNVCLEKIFVCDEVKDCDDGRDEKNCKDYVKQFDVHENSRLDVLEKQRYDNVTEFTCALLCIQSRKFECKSFNYRKIDRACFLTDENIGQSGALQTYYPCDYYERKSSAMDCSNMHHCPNGKCLTSNQVCDGFNDCGNREDEKNCKPEDFGYEVKLAGSTSGHEGRVEVTVFNQTGFICDDQFSIKDANVLCRELGFPLGAAEVKGNSLFAKELKENHTLYMMDDLECVGNETSLMDCNFAGWGIHNCGDYEIAGVVCKTPEDECGEGFWKCDTGNECVRVLFVCDGLDDCTDNSDEATHHCDAPTAVRLVNGTTEKEGRLEVRHHGIWGSVCDDDFNEDAAKIVCKYLGYTGSALVKKEGYYGSGQGPIWLDQVSCLGNETTLEDCTHWEWGEHNCDHSEDVGIVCNAVQSIAIEGQRNSKATKDEYVAAESILDPSYESLEPETCGYRKDNIFIQSDDVHFRVVQGSIAKPGDYPWQAALKVKAHEKTAHWCGAVVIASKWVLTAAHCLEGYSKGAYVVVAGEYNIDENEGTEQQAYIEEYYVHENFRKGHKMGNDIALIKLKGSGFKLNQDIQPICLPEEGTDYERDELNCTISGFGTVQTGKSAYSHHLRAAWIPIQKLDICKMAHIYGEQIGDGMICAGDLEGGVDACDGDSGGPLACLENGVFTLYGVTSWGQRCGYANKPGVYVKVSHYKKWIDKIIKSHSS